MNVGKAKALIAIGADSKQLDKDIAEARKKLKGFKDGAKKLGGKVLGAGKGILGTVMGGFGIQGAEGITSLVSGVFDLEDGLSRFQIATSKTNAEMSAFRAQILGVSKATGVSAADILNGAQSYVDLTGDVKGAQAAMSSFARISQASGATVADVAAAAAAMQQSLGIDSKDIEAVFSGMIMQGKAGAVSLKDFAKELSALAPRWAKFAGGSTAEGVAQMGAAFQVARQGFGSASEAATGLEALMGAITQNAGKFEKAGVKIFSKSKNGTKSLRSFDQIIASIGNSKLMKDPTALAKAFGSKEAAQAFDMLKRARSQMDATSGKSLWQSLIDAGKDTGAVQRDLDTRLQSTAGKLQLAFNTLKVAVAEAFTPERIEKFVSALGKALAFAAKLVGYIEKIADFVLVDVDKSTNQVAGELKTDILKKTANLTDDQKRAKAAQFLREASANNEDNPFAQQERASKRMAAEALDPSLARRDDESSWQHMRRVRQPVVVKTEVKVGGDSVVRATGNAPSQLTRPGGN